MDENELLSRLSDETSELVSSGKWEEAYNSSKSREELEIVVALYLRNLPYWNNIKEGEFALQRIYEELGFNANDNPFVTFLSEFFKLNSSTKLKNEDFVVLNDLYYNDVLDYSDFVGISSDAFNSIIFSANLYDDFSKNDKKFIITSYIWLSSKENLNRINTQAIVDTNTVSRNIVDNIVSIYTENQKNSIKLRDAIIYRDVDDIKGDINSKRDIETALIAGSSRVGKSRETRDVSVRKIIKDVDSLSGEQKRELVNALKDIGINSSEKFIM